MRKLLALHALAGGAPLSEYTETGNPVTFETNAAKPLSVVAAFSPVQAGSGDPSPENIRPITGFTGANIYLSPTDADDPAKQTFAVTFPALGKNLFDISKVESGTLDGYGNKVANASRTVTGFITLKAGTYTISRKAATDWWKIWSYTLDEEPLQSIMNNINTSHTITLSADSKIRIAFDYIVDSGNEVQLESGSSATAYEPYTNTAYGGTLDLTTGVLTVDKESITIDGNTPVWSTYNNPQAQGLTFSIGLDNKALKISSSYCDKFKNAGNVSIWDYDVRGVCADNRNQARLFFNAFEPVADLNAWKAWIAENNLQVVYELATPVTYQLTPTEILSLIGNNTIWSDLNGDLTVIYKKKG